MLSSSDYYDVLLAKARLANKSERFQEGISYYEELIPIFSTDEYKYKKSIVLGNILYTIPKLDYEYDIKKISHYIKELELNWIKAPSKFFKSTFLIAVLLYLTGVISAILWFEWIMFISVSIGLLFYTILHQNIVHRIIAESDYNNHKILIKTTMSKTWLYIGNVLVEKHISIFESSFKLSGKVGDEIIKVNMSRFASTKCSVFVE